MFSRIWGLDMDLGRIFIQIFAFLALEGLRSGCEVIPSNSAWFCMMHFCFSRGPGMFL